MSRVAIALSRVQDARDVEVVSQLPPADESTFHGGDLGVTELFQGLSGEDAPDPAGAVNDDLVVFAGHDVLGPALEMSAREVAGPRDDPLLDLFLLAHIEELQTGAALEALGHLLGRRLVDLGPGLDQEVPEVSHISTLQ
jgi:hypothetical protein